MPDIKDDFDFEEEVKQEKKGYKERRVRIPTKASIRNLWQYKDMSDEEFEAAFGQKYSGVAEENDWEDRIQDKIKQFGNDYDLEELNSNDMMLLRALAQSFLSLEDLEKITYRIRQKDEITFEDLPILEKLSKIMSDLRGDISKLQDDLKITRKTRKSDKEQSVISYIEDLKKKAREFYDQKMLYVVCPKCNMLLGTVWAHYPLNNKNKLMFECERILEDGSKCGEKVVATTKEMSEKRGSNKPEIFPESVL